MTMLFYLTVIGTLGLMIFNLWGKSIFISIACILGSIYIALTLDATDYTQIYQIGIAYFVMASNIGFLLFKVEHL
jgi:hypothetical protein